MPEPVPDDVRRSQQLELCSDKLVLSLEDDAPVRGPRARFLVDIMNPCWLWRGVELSRGATLVADVGQFPFNFQIGRERDAIHLRPPLTADGELEVRVDGCDGPQVAALPLAPARRRGRRHATSVHHDSGARRHSRPVLHVHGHHDRPDVGDRPARVAAGGA